MSDRTVAFGRVPQKSDYSYHPDVRVFEGMDADGKPLALFYCDHFKRDGDVQSMAGNRPQREANAKRTRAEAVTHSRIEKAVEGLRPSFSAHERWGEPAIVAGTEPQGLKPRNISKQLRPD